MRSSQRDGALALYNSCALDTLVAKYKANEVHECELEAAVASTSSRIDEQSWRILGLQAELDGLGRTMWALEDANDSAAANLWQALFSMEQALSDIEPELIVTVRHGLAAAWRALPVVEAQFADREQRLKEALHQGNCLRARAAAAEHRENRLAEAYLGLQARFDMQEPRLEDLASTPSTAIKPNWLECELVHVSLEEDARLDPELRDPPADEPDVEWERRNSDAEIMAVEEVSSLYSPVRPVPWKRLAAQRAGPPICGPLNAQARDTAKQGFCPTPEANSPSSPVSTGGQPSPRSLYAPPSCLVFSLCGEDARVEVAGNRLSKGHCRPVSRSLLN